MCATPMAQRDEKAGHHGAKDAITEAQDTWNKLSSYSVYPSYYLGFNRGIDVGVQKWGV